MGHGNRHYWNRLLLITMVIWICAFMLLSLRMLSTADESAGTNLFKVINMAGRALIPNVPAEYLHVPYEEVVKVQRQKREMNRVLQVMAPVYENASNNYAGAGEMNAPVIIEVDKLNAEEKSKYDKGWADHAFNEYASKKISLNRKLPDFRDEECKLIEYKDSLPTTSVIIIFHNEAWTVLLRTVQSVINESPSQFLEEVILVDDASDKDYLGKPLDDYVAGNEKVKLIRLRERSGLIVARIAGSDAAKGEVVLFLDSHCEVITGWLEPLLDVLDKNPKASVVPIIETINDETFVVNNVSIEGIQVGGFTWDLIFNWHTLPERERLNRTRRTDPIRTPTMAGGLFAIRKDWFEALGKYDPQLRIWGGENLELSLKVWMCGGELVTSPCSHVGHIFRKRSPYKWPSQGNVVLWNTMRVALVWLDEFLPDFLVNVPKDKRDPKLYGDLTDRHEIRKRLKCKNFSYFYDNIYPELFRSKNMRLAGDIKNQAAPFCVDSHAEHQNDVVIAYPCHGMLGPQLWYLSPQDEIRKEEYCLDYSGGMAEKDIPDKVIVYRCHNGKGNQFWKYLEDQRIEHSSGLCLAINSDKKLVMTDCKTDDLAQKWTWKHAL